MKAQAEEVRLEGECGTASVDTCRKMRGSEKMVLQLAAVFMARSVTFIMLRVELSVRSPRLVFELLHPRSHGKNEGH